MRILLVEDETTIAVTLTDDLEAGGHEVQHVGDGHQALARLEHEAFDCVISDLRLPGADGLRVLAEARSRNPAGGAILITACPRDEHVAACRALGAPVVQKPFRNDLVVSLVTDLRSPPASRPPPPAATP